MVIDLMVKSVRFLKVNLYENIMISEIFQCQMKGINFCQLSSNSKTFWRKNKWRPCPFTHHRTEDQDRI